MKFLRKKKDFENKKMFRVTNANDDNTLCSNETVFSDFYFNIKPKEANGI